MRVSLPISTVGRAWVLLSTRPTACARRSTKSGVMGASPTVPRMPSVPKYVLLMMVSPSGSRLCDSRGPDLQGGHGFPDVVHPDDARAAVHREHGRGHAGDGPFVDELARDRAQRRLARPTGQQRA